MAGFCVMSIKSSSTVRSMTTLNSANCSGLMRDSGGQNLDGRTWPMAMAATATLDDVHGVSVRH